MVRGKKAHPPTSIWSPNPNIYCNDVAILTFAESQSGSDGRGLRSYRHVRTHRQSGVGLQRYRHRAATLVRHVGVAETSDRTVAHAEGPGRRRQKLSKTTKQPTSRQLNTKKHHRCHHHQNRHHRDNSNIIIITRPSLRWIYTK